MNGPSLTTTELLHGAKRPQRIGGRFSLIITELLSVPCDIARVKTIGELLQHIVLLQLVAAHMTKSHLIVWSRLM